MIACESLLVEHGLVGAEERPFCILDDVSFIVFNGEADVEDLKCKNESIFSFDSSN